MDAMISKLMEFFTLYSTNVLAALIILIVGRWVAKFLADIIQKLMTTAQMDATLRSFGYHVSYVLLMTIVIIAALNKLGVQTTSLIAVLGTAGLAVALALKDSLNNFAAGFMLIILRPLKVGDYVEAGGAAGTVEAVHIFNTLLKTPDNREVTIPNSQIISQKITNYSARPTRRLDLVFGISYDDDLLQAKQILKDIIAEEKRILEEPAPLVGVLELGDNSVNFAFRPWVKTEEYWDVYYAVMEEVKLRFDDYGITIPYPQRDIHLFDHSEDDISDHPSPN